MIIKGERGEGINLKFGINMYTLLYVKQINNKDLLYSTGNYIQYLVINYNGVITHLEPDILECEVKRALGSITMNKASEVMVF